MTKSWDVVGTLFEQAWPPDAQLRWLPCLYQPGPAVCGTLTVRTLLLPCPPGLSTWRWSMMRTTLGTWRSRGMRSAALPTWRVRWLPGGWSCSLTCPPWHATPAGCLACQQQGLQ